MKLLLKWVIEIPPSPLSKGKSLLDHIDNTPEFATVYYMKHDGIGHQWTDKIHNAKQFISQKQIDELLLDLQDYNYSGVFGTEESISETIDNLGDL